MPTDTFKPGFFVLGAAKCGTNSLNQYFDRMPDVCVPWPKESSFFSHHFDKGMDYYRRTYFGHWRGRELVGDMSVFNLYCPDAPSRIHQLVPDAQLIVMVRNPIERALADWNFQSQRGERMGPLAHLAARIDGIADHLSGVPRRPALLHFRQQDRDRVDRAAEEREGHDQKDDLHRIATL